MSWKAFDYVLLRCFLPIILLGASLTRYNAFSFAYLLLLLICPLLHYNISEFTKKFVYIYLSILITLSTLFSLSIPIFHIPRLAGKDVFTNCSDIFTSASFQIGIVDLKGVKYYRVFRLVLPDYIVLITSIVLLIYFRKRCLPKESDPIAGIQSTDNDTNNDPCNVVVESDMGTLDHNLAGPSNLIDVTVIARNEIIPSVQEGKNTNTNYTHRPNETHNYLQETFGLDQLRKKFWRAWAIQSLFVFFNVVVIGFAGIVSPSILNAIYLSAFLGVCTSWALGNKVITAGFAYMRIFLLMYSAIHLCLLYLVQIESMQSVLPNGQFTSRLMGLYYLFDTSCIKNGEFIFQPQRWIDYLSPCTIMYVYYLCATETRRWFEKGRKSIPPSYKEDSKFTSIKIPDSRNSELQTNLITDKDIGIKGELNMTDYQSTSNVLPLSYVKSSDLTQNTGNSSAINVDSHINGYVENSDGVLIPTVISPPNKTAKPLLLSLINTSIRNSFVFTFIAMMAWSVTYKSWMSFILLLSACIIWMMPDSRKACLYMSPLIVFYAICLILIQYIYGFNLPELPNATYLSNNQVIDFAEIGLCKWDIPTGPLAVMIGYLTIFWLTLRLFMSEKVSKIPEVQHQSKHEDSDSKSNEYSEAYFGNVDNAIYRKIISFFDGLCEKYWILVCCFAMLLISVKSPVVVFNIVYMFLLMYFLLTFMFSYTFWRKQMYTFWWIVIVYSVIVLLCIYTFQFKQFPYLWRNETGLKDNEISDIGMQKYGPAALFRGLLTPVVFLVVIIVQVRYFHKPFLRISSMNRFKNKDTLVLGENEAHLEESPSTVSTSDASAFIEDVNSVFQMVVEKSKKFFELIYTKVWRFFECHFTKIVAFAIMNACVNDVNPLNVVLILILVVGFPFPRLHAIVIGLSFIWCSVIVLSKMICQLTFFSIKSSNCSENITGTYIINNAKFIGLERLKKEEDFQEHIWRWTAVLVLCAMWYAVKYHQKQYYSSPDTNRPPKGIIFPEISVKTIDDSLINLIKFSFNFTFYKLGLEFCHIVTIIVACTRVDVYSVIYLVLLLIFVCTPRRVCSKMWLPYMWILGVLLLIQYIFCVGIPPMFCISYHYNDNKFFKINDKLREWLYLPSYISPPEAKKLIGDFFQFILVALQYKAFKIESSSVIEGYGGGRNRSITNNELPKSIDKDFISTKNSYIDYLKHAIFYWSYWISLAVVFATGVMWITLFCLGYMILAFIYLWMGQNIMLRKRSDLIASWNVIIYYNFFVILSKCCLQLMGCVYMEEMVSNKLVWIIQLFGVNCINPMNNLYNPENKVENGLYWDFICFVFIILQRKIFMTKSFCHVVLDLNVQNCFASRGASLINKKLMLTIRDQTLKEERMLEKIKIKLEKISQRQAQHGKTELNEHYLVIRSGDYHLFDGDPEEDDDCVQDLEDDDDLTISKKALISTDDATNTPWSDSNSEETLINDQDILITKPIESGQNPVKKISAIGIDRARKASVPTKKISMEIIENDNENVFNDSSEEDDANPVNTQNTIVNPLQLINRAMEQGPRSAVREFKRTQSECRENAIVSRKASFRRRSRLESMSEQEELGSLREVVVSPLPQRSGSVTDDSFHSASPQHDLTTSADQFLLHQSGEGQFIKSTDNIAPSPSIYRDAASTTELLDCENQDLVRPTQLDIPIAGNESCWSKFKASVLVLYYFIQSASDNIIIIINGMTKEYRRICRTLENEKRLVKRQVISDVTSEVDCRIQIEEVVRDIVGNKNNNQGLCKNTEECLKEQEFRRSRSRFFLLAIALGNFAIIYSEFICYFLLILNQMLSCNLFSLPYPLMVFLWALLSVPRPSKNFWIVLITYTEIVIVIKYIFQFQFIEFNIITQQNQNDPSWTSKIIGIEKNKHYAVLDLIQLLFIFLHRGYLKNTGSWRNHVEFTKELDIIDKEENIKDKVQPPDDKLNLNLGRSSFNPIIKMRRFYAKMTNPKFNKKVDVYVYMFLCEFLSFWIIIFGYTSFGPGTASGDTAFDFIKTNKIPYPFIMMIITQFVFIIIDRALFLRKQVKGKFIFQIFYVILIHVWLFFILPQITKKPFNSQVAPKLLYFVKCVYFALSAYQMKSGYPLRILGNFLTRNFNYVNLILFKAYMIVPFLYELRNVMDWMWTDSAMALYHWMEIEDIFCKIFVLKCWRRAELEYPTLRGRARRLASKYSVGGLLLAFFFICLWSPLIVSSFITDTFVKNPPLDCDITLNIGGFTPIYSFNARENNLQNFTEEAFQNLKKCYDKYMKATNYLNSFTKDDVVVINIDEVSGQTWAINPPGIIKLQSALNANATLHMNMKVGCERKSTDSKNTDKYVTYTKKTPLSYEDRYGLLRAINESSSVSFPSIFPRYLTAMKSQLDIANSLIIPEISPQYTFLNLELTMKNKGDIKWWDLGNHQFNSTFCASDNKTDPNNIIKVFVFSERVSDTIFGHLFTSYGIIGIYAAYIFVAHRLLRSLYSDISFIIRLEELPHVDRIFNLLNEIYLVRENKMFRLEEQLIAKLIFLYRSSEMMIKWTRNKKSTIEKHTETSKDTQELDFKENETIVEEQLSNLNKPKQS